MADKVLLDSLENALKTLKEAIEAVDQAGPRDALIIRDGAIQRFEYTYGLTLRAIRRILELKSDVPEEVDRMGFKDLIREASARELIVGTVETWVRHRESRNRTSHAYDETQAAEIFSNVRVFAEEVEEFLIRARRQTEND
jgi:nucleotidyltransferase substrate binding protein (TIGR01987 family)